MPEEWKTFTLKTLEIEAATCPLNFAPLLSEKMKDGVQNNTPLLLNTTFGNGEVNIDEKLRSTMFNLWRYKVMTTHHKTVLQ